MLSARLTPQELRCLEGVAQLKRSSEIAYDLNLKAKTVDAYIATAVRKVGASDRTSAVRLLLEAEPGLWGKSPITLSPVAAADPSHSKSRLPGLQWPWPTERNPEVVLSFAGKLAMVAILMMAGMLVVTFYVGAVILVDWLFNGRSL